jgi:hypothetical protein
MLALQLHVGNTSNAWEPDYWFIQVFGDTAVHVLDYGRPSECTEYQYAFIAWRRGIVAMISV